MMKTILLFFGVTVLLSCQEKNKAMLLENLLSSQSKLEPILKEAGKYEVQILYTQIDRDDQNHPRFTSYAYRLDPAQYFYPASTIKMPIAILAMEKMNKLGLPLNTAMRIDSVRPPQTSATTDSTSENLLPSVAHYVKKIFVVSDNDASNRLYEFLGQDYLNNQLKAKGYGDTKIIHRLGPSGAPFSVEDNRFTNPVVFYAGDRILYQQPGQEAQNRYPQQLKSTLKGIGYMRDGKLINAPMDFSQKNFFPLKDMQAILKAVLFPEAIPPESRFDLKETDYRYLYKVMSMRPAESRFPNYRDMVDEDGKGYFDSYGKFFLFGDSEDPMPGQIRIFNKVGWAYGYLTDCAYIVDFENNIEFLLAATIHVNENQIFNDNHYEYLTVGLPFLAELGRVIYQYELKRERSRIPDLSKFKIDYGE